MTDETPRPRTLVVADIHGRADRLAVLMDRLSPVAGLDRLVFLGDYVDRGDQTRQVLDFLIGLQRVHTDAVFLLGNHEAALLRYAVSRDPEDLRRLRRMGFEATLESYGTLPGSGLDFMPQEHLAFLKGLARSWRSDGLVCFHAPIPWGRDPEAVGEEELEAMLASRSVEAQGWAESGETLVFGHVPFLTPLVAPGLMGIDTGAGRSGTLTALEWPARRFHHA